MNAGRISVLSVSPNTACYCKELITLEFLFDIISVVALQNIKSSKARRNIEEYFQICKERVSKVRSKWRVQPPPYLQVRRC